MHEFITPISTIRRISNGKTTHQLSLILMMHLLKI
jgi:hypothetical protein